LSGNLPLSSRWFCSSNQVSWKFHHKKEPFHPTWSSTKQQIRHKCVDTAPKQVVASVSAVPGGVLRASAPGQLPRDEKQVTNFKAREGLALRQCATNVNISNHIILQSFVDYLIQYEGQTLKKVIQVVFFPINFHSGSPMNWYL